ncbi:hydroxysteroid dehydrogenase-like protein 2 [Trichonephila clavata]|uniref:Hydroxysteroid dehydrogenase-like protein 2 n=1 Tax=Trichonephila clavata TaxID=2740835 RepID=A0A8X6I0Y0_TRICU|nr:hydroxysteroid dehydrogenase-like protein 2 [Trichonephila clavata]
MSMSLAGKTLFITGASRGIGKAIAIRAARDGANVVIAAKTNIPHPKLEGTVHSAAQEVYSRSKDYFCHNLCVAVHLILITCISKLCMPHLKKSSNAHILNISPPLLMEPRWFKSHVAYTMAKYGMSMCVLGMADELKSDNICVNALWPKTAIATAAMEMLGGKDITKNCRKPTIMADAAYAILTGRSTGKFYIDEKLLKELGVTNFDEYAVDKNEPLAPDFSFLKKN